MLNDRDVLAAEPSLFSEACFTSQILCRGTNGIVAGTQFTASGVDFSASGVTAGGVIWLESVDGSIKGGFEIVTLIDSTHLTLSILRSDPAGSAIPVGSASGLTWSVKTYAPQIAAAEIVLSHRLRCLPGWEAATETLETIDNADTVKVVWLYLLLADLFGALYGDYPAYTAESAAAAWGSHKAKRIWYRGTAERTISLLK